MADPTGMPDTAVVGLCVASAGLAGWFGVPIGRTPRGLGVGSVPLTDPNPGPQTSGPRSRRRAAAGLCGLSAAVLVGGPAGLLVGAVLAPLVARWLAGRAPAGELRRHARLVADLPTAADLLAACLLAGATPVDAVATVADAVGGPLGDELRSASGAVRLGADPVRAWSELARHGELAALARALARSGDGGAPLAERVARLADEARERQRRQLTAVARRTAVRATVPLGVCFLPAFLCVGVVPVVVGLAGPLLNPG
ncbi:type II secretion system F family protein [Yinghuangia seranimata]|uniref:type II secretion system F family protein n=1 Tax=Yinghuangia seranimata TaxID=408067 RepID=UPI00248B0489|nr:type II secretion system F family protein [Yinghuangia seranimata]MDI2127923.1 type II secretion system F family protein [Yinghuangia seranimata]